MRRFLITYATPRSVFNSAFISTEDGHFLNQENFIETIKRDFHEEKVMITYIYEFKSEQDYQDFIKPCPK